MGRCAGLMIASSRSPSSRSRVLVAVATLGVAKLRGEPRAARSRRLARGLDRRRRPRRPAVAPLHLGGRAMAAAGDHARRRSALSRDARRLRGRALLRASRRRRARASARGPAMAAARPCRLGRLDAVDAGRAPDRAAARAHSCGEAPPDRARARDRAGGRQAGRPRPLSDAARRSAAISRACGRPRSPGSARSR